MQLNAQFQQTILKCTSARGFSVREVIQELWSGYGQILRIDLEGSKLPSVVVKHVQLPSDQNHPRGWNTDLSHQRKLKSYQVETAWYQHYADQCDEGCKVPVCLAVDTMDEEVLIVLEDLDASGFSARRTSVNWQEIETCLSWLAYFHVQFLDLEPAGLWETGTYWHLDTRPEELASMSDLPLKAAATDIDARLKNSHFQTLVHGDAKLANFCFSPNGVQVAAVDFQYVGRGCGMKDVAYFVGSCLNERDCERYEETILNHYFSELRTAINLKGLLFDVDGLEEEWRQLYPVAWTDFHRFLKGWSPGHWKINSYSERIARETILKLR